MEPLHRPSRILIKKPQITIAEADHTHFRTRAAGAAKAREVNGEVLPDVFVILDAVRCLQKARQVRLS